MQKNSLQFLVASLTQGEKMYFRKYGFPGTTKESLPLKIYSLVERDANISNESIAQKLNKSEMRQQAISKFLLYEEILESLYRYKEKDLIYAKYIQRIMQTKLLFEKGLREEAALRLEKYIQQLTQYEQFDVLLIAWNILKGFYRTDDQKALLLDDCNKAIEQCLAQINNLQTCSGLLDFVYVRRAKKGTLTLGNIATTESWKPFTSHPFFNDDILAHSVSAKLTLYLAKAFYYATTQDTTMESVYLEKMRELYDSSPYYKSRNVFNYFVLMNQYLNLLNRTSKAQLFDEYYKNLQREKPKLNANESARLFLIMSNLALLRIMGVPGNIGFNYDLNRMVKDIDKHKKYTSETSIRTLYANLAITFFQLKEYKKSLVFVQKILLNLSDRNVSVHYKIAVTLLIMIELQQKDYAGASISLKKYFHTDAVDEYFDVMSRKVNTLVECTSARTRQISYMHWHQELDSKTFPASVMQIWYSVYLPKWVSEKAML
jgi:hypothetical protein